jgi:hypothetical protein
MKGFVITVLAIAVGVAVVAPREDSADKPAPAQASAVATAGSSDEPAWSGGAQGFRRAGVGPFYATPPIEYGD